MGNFFFFKKTNFLISSSSQKGVLDGKETFFYWNERKTENETFCSLKIENGKDVISDDTLKKFNIPCYTNFKFSKNEKYAIFKLDVEKVTKN